MTVGFTSRYNPLNIAWEYRDWQDCYRDGPGGNSCSGADPYGTNGDDVVQDWEVGPGRVRPNAPGSMHNERINVLDLRFGKVIGVGHARVRLGADIYNVLNPDTILRRQDNYGASLGAVREVVLGRFWKLLTQVGF